MEVVILRRRPLHQMEVAQGEGVGVHHDSGGSPLPAGFLQGGAVVRKAPAAVLHEDQAALHPGDLIEAQVTEKFGALGLGVEEEMGVSPLRLHLHQVGDDLVEQALPLPAAGHRQTTDGVPKAAAGGGQVPVLVKQAAGVVQIAVPADALLLQEGVHLSLGPCVPGGDGSQRVAH